MSSSLKSKIESLLFISARPMSLNEMIKVLKSKKEETEKAVEGLKEEYNTSKRGLEIIKEKLNYQMVSAGANSNLIKEFIKDETRGELTRPSLEALSIIAYRGPISKIDLERIRGVNCSLILRNLLIRGLVKVEKDKKREEEYYSVSIDFLRFLGVNDINKLPNYDSLSQDDTLDRIIEEDSQNLSK